MSTLTQSYTHGASAKPLIGETIGAYFDNAAARWSAQEALVVPHQNVRWTFAQLKEEVDAFAAGLIALGLQPGDRIGIWSQNTSEWTISQFATAKAGLILVNINPAYRLSELEYALNKVACTALIISPSFKTSDYIGMVQTLAPEIETAQPGQLRAEKLPHLTTVIRMGDDATPGMYNFADISAMANDKARQRMAELAGLLQFDEPINIQFTSGTTGFPKGATLTHHNILNNGFFVGEAIEMVEGDRLAIPVPLYHCFGMVMGNLACITHGATMVYPGEGFDPTEVLRAVQDERCTALYGVPTMFIAALDHADFDKFDLSTLRTGIMAGSPCPIEVMKQVVDKMNMHEVTIAYGMTETSPVSFSTAVDDELERKVGTVGRSIPHEESKIVDSDGRIVAPGETGEILTRGYNVMLGYWDDDVRTAEAIDDAGWMHTGDLGTMDEHGYGNVVGRIKDMVIRGGENIYPREIEEYLYRHDKIQDVQVIGVPDPKFVEELCAWIILREGETADADEIKAFCRGQIAHYKVPRYIKFVEEFPMTVTGKVQKFVMRDQMIEELNLEVAKTA
ncbi:MAG: AMP-binding protein [Rhodospirillaceae bacterium]|nr:AMP-binding protein [Rhodospirillaceae bacterium]